MILHLGVDDLPYSNAPSTPRRQGKVRKRKRPMKARKGSGASSKTTGDVAEILERKYGIMAFFADAHMPEIAHELEESIAGQLENVLMGRPPGKLNFNKAESEIAVVFRNFLDAREMDNRVAGVPTAAALAGVNHRLKHPYRKSNPERSSFVDSGTYQAAFRAWMES
jgi:hypothetical protein